VRALALVLPWLPTEIVERASPELARRPLVLFERTKTSRPRRTSRPGASNNGALRVVAENTAARQAGIFLGSTCAQARATVPELVVRERRSEEEHEVLLGLARWASRVLSPRVGVEERRRAVLVDVTGTALVHGSEERLVERAVAELEAFGFHARGAVADTILAALAFAQASEVRVVPEGLTRERLLPLPVSALALDEGASSALEKIGVRSIGELLRLPRATLPARLGEAALLALDRALGERPDELVPVKFPELLRERVELEGGTDRRDDLVAVLEDLAVRVGRRLAAEGRAARSIELSFRRDGGAPLRLSWRLPSPVAQARALFRMLEVRLEKVDLSFPVTRVELVVAETARRAERQGDLFSEREDGDEDLAELIARLESRLGARGVLRVSLVADHRPERAVATAPASASLETRRPKPVIAGRRPTQLLAKPRPIAAVTGETGRPASLSLDGRTQSIARATGPERIEAGFWEGNEARRDYWVVKDEAGVERWIFRELDSGRWFLHGIFD
jgi:protein ImuB